MDTITRGRQLDPQAKSRPPLWLLPNLLSIDAPLVAVAWMWMLAKALRVEYIQSAVWWVLPTAIWCVYVLDRLLDGWAHLEVRDASPRHQFHWRWRWWLLSVALVAGGVSIYQSLYVLSRSMFSAGLVALLLCGIYFLLAYFRGREVPYTKNLMAGMIFAMGIGIPVNAASATLLVTDLNDVIYAWNHTGLRDAIWNVGRMVVSTLVVVFYQCTAVWVLGLLCMMNITAIDLWEKVDGVENDEDVDGHEAALSLGLIVLAGGSLVFAAMQADEYSKPFFYAVMVAAASLQVINHYRDRFTINGLRVLADVALLVPLPVFLVA
ncbi:MAG: hypothetical protein KJO21_13210 [Verrucomicrobiae bacterium]|nr:hypothetical protein [Verrucomicrobiae bacterium]NNJ44278.1 hypothetical protein [Akkermansiaceae bacterium]